MAEGDSHITF
ncbi:hypothetical protein E2C01_074151 [Portunus trituberculatus]|uniref:Uncharacterized protein n=1 Tax=Portunus trituberculatus TaxID=210409 RepID=A0A5B7IBN7_PORTR|nr:hypothetical protein [Portunus trituberculatus]